MARAVRGRLCGCERRGHHDLRTVVCGLQLQCFISIAVLAFAMATLQTLVLAFAGVFIGGLQFFAFRAPARLRNGQRP